MGRGKKGPGRDGRVRAVFRPAWVVEQVLGQRDPRVGRLGGYSRYTDQVLLLFIRNKVEGLFLADRPADRHPVVLVAQRRSLRRRRARNEKGRVSSKGFISIEVVHGAMNRVSTRFGHHVYRAAGIAPALRAGLCL